MALLHNRLHSEGVHIPELDNLIEIYNSQTRQQNLIKNWQRINTVNYAPVLTSTVYFHKSLYLLYVHLKLGTTLLVFKTSFGTPLIKRTLQSENG